MNRYFKGDIVVDLDPNPKTNLGLGVVRYHTWKAAHLENIIAIRFFDESKEIFLSYVLPEHIRLATEEEIAMAAIANIWPYGDY
jgi:cellulose biosynthesis protein BcsQ